MFDVNPKKTIVLILVGLAILIFILQMQRNRMKQLESFEDKSEVLEELQKTQPENIQKIPTH